jgi:DNA-binding transcriptional LysR family regulator
MNLPALDLDTLRTLVVAKELGGYGRAGARLGRTPSAISLQMKRLQQDVGATLFRKDGRGLALTESGEIVLRYARRMLALNDELLDTVRGAALIGRVRIGMSQDFAETVLPAVLSRFAALYPLVVIEVRIDGNAALVDAVRKRELDIALAVGHAEETTSEQVGVLELVWIAGKGFTPRAGQPLPLVMLGPQCQFRQEAIRKLEDASLPWRIAALSPSLAGVWASARGGLGITVRSAAGLPSDLVCDGSLFGLPPLASFPITLHVRPGAVSAGVARLQEIVREVVVAKLPRRRAIVR